MKAVIAKKIGMTRIFDENSNSIGVTVLDVSTCRTVQIKSEETDGYSAAQLTIGKAKNISNPLQKHYSKYDVEPGEQILEVLIDSDEEILPGTEINVSSIFSTGDLVDISGVTKGKGFAGVMKRHNFSGQKASHGVHKVHRAGGSIGNASYPGRVFKGQKMAGRMGGKNATVQNIRVVEINQEKNYLLVDGPVPGSRGTVVLVSTSKKVNNLDPKKQISEKINQNKNDEKVPTSNNVDTEKKISEEE